MAFPDVLRLTTATPFFCSRLLTANYPATPHIPISSIESDHIPSVVFPGFVTPSPVLLTSAAVHCLRSASIVFAVVFFFGIRLPDTIVQSVFFSTYPIPTTGGPRRYKQHDPDNLLPLTRCMTSMKSLSLASASWRFWTANL